MRDDSSSSVTANMRLAHLARKESVLSRKFGSGSLVIRLHVILAYGLIDHEQGTVLPLLRIGVNGRVLPSKEAKSSGVPLLDETARAGMALCKYKPGTVNGTPHRSWKKLRFVWRLPYWAGVNRLTLSRQTGGHKG